MKPFVFNNQRLSDNVSGVKKWIITNICILVKLHFIPKHDKVNLSGLE